MQQVEDFRAECEALFELLEGLKEEDFTQKTQFKEWTIDDIVGHLHYFNLASELALEGEEKFMESMASLFAAISSGKSMVHVQWELLQDLRGKALVEEWIQLSRKLADTFSEMEPKARLPWFGPSMSARSFITARQMETWSHSQAIYDLLGLDRVDTDRLRNIAHLAAATIPFSFQLRSQVPPVGSIYVRVEAPSGDIWEWNSPELPDRIEGSAVEFCQVAAQTRSFYDTALTVSGPAAEHWPAIAQCFAGAPVPPPAKGTRFKQG